MSVTSHARSAEPLPILPNEILNDIFRMAAEEDPATFWFTGRRLSHDWKQSTETIYLDNFLRDTQRFHVVFDYRGDEDELPTNTFENCSVVAYHSVNLAMRLVFDETRPGSTARYCTFREDKIFSHQQCHSEDEEFRALYDEERDLSWESTMKSYLSPEHKRARCNAVPWFVQVAIKPGPGFPKPGRYHTENEEEGDWTSTIRNDAELVDLSVDVHGRTITFDWVSTLNHLFAEVVEHSKRRAACDAKLEACLEAGIASVLRGVGLGAEESMAEALKRCNKEHQHYSFSLFSVQRAQLRRERIRKSYKRLFGEEYSEQWFLSARTWHVLSERVASYWAQ
ncbi:hypothetical protein LTS10_007749 [Elasticomyces elasticus]|nr:hypothetical protein LTS10_007749 [Elasticomyces elasticus]